MNASRKPNISADGAMAIRKFSLIAVLYCATQVAIGAIALNVPKADIVGTGQNLENVDDENGIRRGLSYQDFVSEVDDNVATELTSEKRSQWRSAARAKDAEMKALKDLLAKQQSAIDELKRSQKSAMQQIDALIVQDRTTLKIIGSRLKSNDGTKIDKLESDGKDAKVITTGGVHYIRWGREKCPSTAVEVYRGFTSGSHYTATAGGVNSLCLHDDPQWGSQTEESGQANYIYGSEYGFASTPFSATNNGGSGLSPNDVPCVVCHTTARSNQMMIPSRRECPTGWTLEYLGYIVSNFAGTYTRGDFICLDEEPEVKAGGFPTSYGMWLIPVKAACGSLTCPKYYSDRPIACVVCTK